MPYDESLFSRVDDGWYAEKANTMATLANEMDIYPGVMLPQRLTGGAYKNGRDLKADWANVIIESSTTADIQDNQIQIKPNQRLEMSFTHHLVNFDKWQEIRLIVDDNSPILVFDHKNIGNPHFEKSGKDYVYPLTRFKDKKLDFTIYPINSEVIIRNIIMKCHIEREGVGTTSLDISNINGLSDFLDNIVNTMYPVGIIVEFKNNANPNEIWKGTTWEKIEDRFLFGAKKDNLGVTGGASSVTLISEELAVHTHIQNSHTHTQDSHNHIQNSHNHTQNQHKHRVVAWYGEGSTYTYNDVNAGSGRVLNSAGAYKYVYEDAGSTPLYGNYVTPTNNPTTATNNAVTATNQNTTATNQNAGGGKPHENMPPYLAVNIWTRIK